jgi:alpha-D-ribose 1-methylphosphonate 5-triphosphate synthase subunit PhnL
MRALSLGYVSQFLRVIPRLATIDVVAEPLLAMGTDRAAARARAAALLDRLNLPERLWSLSPVSFSGGEQQRVNIARGLLPERPILLLDEPTAALDERNRSIVAELIKETKRRGVAVVSIVHDQDVRASIADTVIDVTRFSAIRS